MKVTPNCKRLFLWSGPRNVSTTLMYSFAQREDTAVFDEPLYGAYLSHSQTRDDHPGFEQIIDSMPNSYDSVIAEMCNTNQKPVAFFKNMAHHLLDCKLDFLKEGINIILTRDPIEMLPSFDKVISDPKIEDVGYKAHSELVDSLKSMNADYVVLDATFLLKNPVGVLKQLCEACGISFDSGMLSWDAGPRPEDGVWAKYWYRNVHLSRGYQPYKEKSDAFPDHLRPLLKECVGYYQKLQEVALR